MFQKCISISMSTSGVNFKMFYKKKEFNILFIELGRESFMLN